MATTTEAKATPGLYRLLAWLSPSFPTGAFSYSHGLEAAAADGSVRDRLTLEAWIAAIVAQGSGRIDADILVAAYRAAAIGDDVALAAAYACGAAFRATAELALESAQQGMAFEVTRCAAWRGRDPHPNLPAPVMGNPPPLAGEGRVGVSREGTCQAAVLGAAAAGTGIALDDVLLGYLQAFAANLVSAGIRLSVIGQTDGQRILAALEPVVATAAEAALSRDPDDFGSATFAVDLASMTHEVQYTRLFRS